MIATAIYLIMYAFVCGGFMASLVYLLEYLNGEGSTSNAVMVLALIASIMWPLVAPAVLGAWLVSAIIGELQKNSSEEKEEKTDEPE